MAIVYSKQLHVLAYEWVKGMNTSVILAIRFYF